MDAELAERVCPVCGTVLVKSYACLMISHDGVRLHLRGITVSACSRHREQVEEAMIGQFYDEWVHEGDPVRWLPWETFDSFKEAAMRAGQMYAWAADVAEADGAFFGPGEGTVVYGGDVPV